MNDSILVIIFAAGLAVVCFLTGMLVVKNKQSKVNSKNIKKVAENEKEVNKQVADMRAGDIDAAINVLRNNKK